MEDTDGPSLDTIKRLYKNYLRRYNRRKKLYLELKKEFEFEEE